MNVYFTGLQAPLLVDEQAVSVLEVHNRALFARLSGSLMSGAGADAVEPYTIWGSYGEELSPSGQFLAVTCPLDLPWGNKALSSGLASHVEQLMFEDEGARRDVEDAFALLRSRLCQLALSLESEYAFDINWELKRYLRTYGFGVELVDDEPLLDKLIKFLALVKDASLNKVILFVNLKLFLTENELELFYEQAFFSKLRILLVENAYDALRYERERKYVIDQDFLESW